MTSQAFAQATDLLERHKDLCLQRETCRINIVPQKTTEIQGICTGRLMDNFNCEMIFSASEKGSSIKILCKDGSEAALIDGFVMAGFLAYKATSISGIGQTEQVRTDASSHMVFDHPAMKLWLQKKGNELTGNVYLLMENQKRTLENLECRFTSESEISSSAQAQIENRP